MAYEALKPYVQEGADCRFISNIDPTDAGETRRTWTPRRHSYVRRVQDLHDAQTITNAKVVRAWLLNGRLREPASSPTRAWVTIAKHFVAVSTALDKVAGIRRPR